MVSQVDWDGDKLILAALCAVAILYHLDAMSFEDTVVVTLFVLVVVVINVPYRLDGGIDR